jgi:5-methylcytosine-specific restriction endonuclease McrBC regulatory subunit McrC
VEVFKLNENSSIGLKGILTRLGYIKLAEKSLPYGAGKSDAFNKAVSRFTKKNRDYLNFLNINVENDKLCSNSIAGIIPLEYAIDTGEKANLVVEPMLNWQILSEFASITKDRDWLSLNENWAVSKALDIELWYFSKPFLDEALSVLKRPAKGFKTISKSDCFPNGNTDWVNYSVQKYPYNKLEFNNKFSISTFDVLPHSLIIWGVEAIKKSLNNYQIVPQSIKDAISKITIILGKNIPPVLPSIKNLAQLPKTGAWAGYINLYKEIEHLAILAGVIKKEKTSGCAYSIKTEKLFEEFTMYLSESFAKRQGFTFFKDTNDSSRIGLIKSVDSGNFKMLNSLRPDIIINSQDLLIVIETKYKRHYDFASNYKKSNPDFDWEAEMRHDLHQAISYTIFSEKKNKLVLLTHPKLTSLSKYHIRRTSRNKNIIVGYLPIHFKSDTTIKSIEKEYIDNLNEIINNFN